MLKWKRNATLLLVTCFVVVSGWFAYSVHIECITCAPRGGAFGVMLSFAALFLLSADRYHSADVLDKTADKLMEQLYEDSGRDPAVLAERNAANIDSIKIDLKRARGQTRAESVCIAIASSYSTLFWGFGDVFARLIIG